MARRKRSRVRRGVSAGTIIMLTLTALVLVGFFAILPSFTGNQDIRLDAAELAVAMDQSFSQLASSTSDLISRTLPRNTVLPPENLPTLLPALSQTAAVSPASTPIPTVTAAPKQYFSLCAAGSIVANNSVRKAFTFDDSYHFDLLTDQITGSLNADLSIATLEHTLADTEKLTDVNMPSDFLSPLLAAGINTLNIGHENILNSGIAGLNATISSISNAGMHAFGALASDQEKNTVSLLDVNGITVALLHYLDDISNAGKKQSSAEERVMSVSPIDLQAIQNDIRSARQAGAQVVIVSLYWGKKGASQPTAAQVEQAQAMANAGADIILGTGSGVLQPVKVLSADRGDNRYHPVLCAYSLGNLFSHERESRTTLASILLKADVVYDAAKDQLAFENLTYTPTYTWRGKDENRTLVRILLNDHHTYPSFVSSDQKTVMERCYKLVQDVMADTGIPMKQ